MPNSRGVWFSVILLIVSIIATHAGLTSQQASQLTELLAQVQGSLSPTLEQSAQTSELPSSRAYPLVSVIDGDTIVVLDEGEKVTVRMIGIDAPETGKGNRPKECFGEEAGAHLSELLGMDEVVLISDTSQDLFDKYGRALMYVEQNGEDINALMIADGYAHEYTYRTPYARQALYRTAKDDAQHAQKGLWAPEACGITSP